MFFFFSSRRRHTRFDCDWSSDVCSSDLAPRPTSDAPGRGALGVGCGAVQVAAGRKCVRFDAEQVHHFAFSLNPRYVYEQGRYGDVVVRVLYLPGDSATWGRGLALGRTITALAWLDSLYGTFAWPQLMNLHRIDRGRTEFPMMVMDESAFRAVCEEVSKCSSTWTRARSARCARRCPSRTWGGCSASGCTPRR